MTPISFQDRRSRAFTLVELMVALALGAIMMSSMIFIFVTSQKIVADMNAKLVVYNYARTAFDIMEKDLANSTKTHDMEFFGDVQGGPAGIEGHYDLKAGDSESIPVLAPDGRPHFLFSPGEKYVYAMTLDQPPEYTGLLDGLKHRADSLYFRTITSINGQTRPVLIEYALDYKKRTGNQVRRLPRLVRRYWIVTKVISQAVGGATRMELNGNAGPNVRKNEPIEDELCLYVTDFQVEFYIQDKRNRQPGRFMSAKEMIQGVRHDAVSAYRNIRMRNFSDVSGGFKVACFYEPRCVNPSGRRDAGIYDRNLGVLRTRSNFSFPMCKPGDRLTVYNSSVGSFKTQDLTIKSIEEIVTGTSNNVWGVRFVEPLPQNLTRDPQVDFRVGFLPSMIRMTIKIKDERAKAFRTMVRQFKLLGA